MAKDILEYSAVALGILYVLLASRSNILCWPVGIVGSAIYVYLNIGWHLYYDTTLQFFYVTAGFYGWWHWRSRPGEITVEIQSWTFSRQMPFIILGVCLSLILGSITFYFFRQPPITFFDAAVAAFSFVATWMTAKKILENWIWWIVIDAAAVVLYVLKDANPTAFLYLFLAIAAYYGFYQWRKQLKLQTV